MPAQIEHRTLPLCKQFLQPEDDEVVAEVDALDALQIQASRIGAVLAQRPGEHHAWSECNPLCRAVSLFFFCVARSRDGFTETRRQKSIANGQSFQTTAGAASRPFFQRDECGPWISIDKPERAESRARRDLRRPFS
jgi:hypothetical protein